MDIGIGLPGHARWSDGTVLVEWARRAEARGFSTLSVSDRLAWWTPEPLLTLAAAAGATSRIRLMTSVLLAPLRANHALFAKTVHTLDQLAGPGRLQLGLAPGLRQDDFELSEVDYGTRGARFDRLLDRLAAATTDGDPVGPRPATPGGPALLFGGTSKAALRRIASRGTGWIAGDATVEGVQDFAPQLRQAWADAGRPGSPRLVASVMYALGPDAETAISDAIGSYYAFAGDEYARYGISIAYTRPEQITAAIAAFDQAGCDELIFMGNDPDPAQVDLLADAIGLSR
ncbi:alkanesulfonate monooxygenase SsuD/methylene tetrahydromethanopterin reductase-like flavin-dependent oxidoreductase (luciferase family) [Actinomadura pelletieri DSM 43383]|uniref:Alkanesulfonate monooxygenase SsuD/methylene tetrahydromethanopterin reductase-like flavin-dependent oxidoreductase (Luciferase family) n=1 Tax=Actinomadura pelletieri DSM 43383 TaxID=1120940 RepID=A0A495R0P2_9ACTN|nr:LLM class flavin-dependent oxidoreductase [Actinomadura pelletieri]RKS79888.1 alkanesulfonate monooxygenase SsuD/methylene tetrahydromethanopterin reductase-like flavin-dependent oxidoreductase (luciferase family) [Actinomadura pelletieri DSM 43383]